MAAPSLQRHHQRRSGPGRALAGVLGIFLFPAAVALLGWNESHMADSAQALAEGAGVVQEAPLDRIDPTLEGRLVHVAGPLIVATPLADPDLPAIQAPPGTVRLRRSVETYQWEERTSRGNAVSYAQVWSDKLPDTNRTKPGGPQNPPPRYLPRTQIVPEAILGAYTVRERLLQSLAKTEPLRPPAPTQPGMQLSGAGLYVGPHPEAPTIGDQRLAWTVVAPPTVSLVARQQGNGFAPFGEGAGERVYLIAPGILAATELIVDAERANAAAGGVMRFVGAGLMFLAILLMLRSPAAPGSLPAPFAWVARTGPATAAALLALGAVSLVIGAAWLIMQPMIGAVILAGLVAATGLLARLLRPRPR